MNELSTDKTQMAEKHLSMSLVINAYQDDYQKERYIICICTRKNDKYQ